MGANIPGKPRRVLVYLGGAPAYRAKCDQVVDGTYPGPAGAQPLRIYIPKGDGPLPVVGTSTAAGSSAAGFRWSMSRCASSPTTWARSSSRRATGSPRSTSSRQRPTTRSRRCGGWPSTPKSSAAIRPASPSWATAPAVAWPRSRRNAPGMRAALAVADDEGGDLLAAQDGDRPQGLLLTGAPAVHEERPRPVGQ